jgi:3-hydroxyacyl-[acyl-carrier-protein] dehydratase
MGLTLPIEEILETVPHRPPFLFLDRIEDLIPGESGIGIYTMKKDEFFYENHFP